MTGEPPEIIDISDGISDDFQTWNKKPKRIRF